MIEKKKQKQEKEKQEFKTITLTESAFQVLEFLSLKSRASKSQIISEFLEQVSKVIYPLEEFDRLNFMFAPNDRNDKIICYFAPMQFSQTFSSPALDQKTTELIDDKIVKLSCDEFANKLGKIREQQKKESEK